jgi:tetratricopeptide (TPR) repeat protein
MLRRRLTPAGAPARPRSSAGSRARYLAGVAAVVALAACAAPPARGQPPSAAEIPALEQRVERNARDVDALTRLGAAYRQAGRLDEAERTLQRALAEDPNDPRAIALQGLTHEELGQPGRARELYVAYLRTGRSRELRRQLSARLHLLERQELREAVRAALAREAELAATAAEPRTVAVFPFAFQGTDPELRPLGRALAEMLVTDLSQTGRLRVLERTGVQMLLDEIELAEEGLVDAGTAARSGRILGAGRIVQGQIGGGEELLRLQAAIVGVGDGWDGHTVNEEDALQRLFDLQKRLSLRIHTVLGIELSPAERLRVERHQTQNLQALLAFGRCLEAEDAGDFQQAAQLCAEAIALDPGFELARERQERAQASLTASQESLERLTQQAFEEPGGSASLQESLEAIQTIVPEANGRSPAAEAFGTEGLGGRAILEIIIRRP